MSASLSAANVNLNDAFTLSNAVAHTFTQVVTAVPIGIVSDWGFNQAFDYLNASMGGARERSGCILSPAHFLVQCIEASAQFIGTGLVTATFFAYLNALPLAATDPSSGAVFAILLVLSQRRLMQRLQNIVDYANDAWLVADHIIESKMRDWFRGARTEHGAPATRQVQRAVKKNAGLGAMGPSQLI